MPISSLKQLGVSQFDLESSSLPLIIHGPISADITLICYGEISAKIIDAALFLDGMTKTARVNIIQLQCLSPLPIIDLKKIIKVSRYLLVVVTDVELDLHDMIQDQVGVKLLHRCYINPGQKDIVAKIVSKVKAEFFIENKI